MDDIIDRIGHTGVNKIAVMGGTFDPIHYGHLVAAEAVRTKYDFDNIIFMPSGTPPHKRGIDVSGALHRLTMVQMATASNPCFAVSSLEIDREGSTYTVDTIREMRAKLGRGIDIFFITGADTIFEIPSWKNPEELFSICSFIAVTRPGYDSNTLNRRIEEMKKGFGGEILTLEIPLIGISSTEIRMRASEGRSIKYLVPECVEHYINKNSLYNKAGLCHE